MFSESCNERHRRPPGRRSRKRHRDRRQLRRNRRWHRRNRRYRRERDPMLNSVLNGDWSNSVPGRKIPEGPSDVRKRHSGRVPFPNVREPFPNVRVSFPNVREPFIWVYNQTFPTKPNLSESLFPTSECLFPTRR